MHRNTYLLIALLAVFAALIIGVHIGRRIAPNTQPTATATPEPETPTPSPHVLKVDTYTSAGCGVSFTYSIALKILESTTSATMQNPTDPGDGIVLTCQRDIPRPPLPPEKIETIQIGTVSAKLYHDASPKDGTPIETLIFRHPKTKLDVFLAGNGPSFTQATSSLTILP